MSRLFKLANILKSAEVFGAEAFVYHGSKSSPEEFLNYMKDFNPGVGGGAMYGKGLYTVYDLEGSATSTGFYGDFIYKLKVNLYGFISFDPDITRKIYGDNLLPSQQYELVGNYKKSIIQKLQEIERKDYSFSSELALLSSFLINGEVKGIIYTGSRDGRCSVIYDASTVVPISWKKVKEDTWNKFTKEEVDPFIGYGMMGEFEKNKYNPDKDQYFDFLNNLSGSESRDPRFQAMIVESAERVINRDPGFFLQNFAGKKWAQHFIDHPSMQKYLDDVIYAHIFGHLMVNPNLKIFLGKNLISFIEKLIKERPCIFLNEIGWNNVPEKDFNWLNPYIEIAIDKCTNIARVMDLFFEKDILKPYLDAAAERSIAQNPGDFLDWYYSKKTNWGKSYEEAAEKAILNQKSDLSSQASIVRELVKLADLLDKNNLNTEANFIDSLLRKVAEEESDEIGDRRVSIQIGKYEEGYFAGQPRWWVSWRVQEYGHNYEEQLGEWVGWETISYNPAGSYGLSKSEIFYQKDYTPKDIARSIAKHFGVTKDKNIEIEMTDTIIKRV